MEAVNSVSRLLLPLQVNPLPPWLGRLDGANGIIGAIMLVTGLLGIVYVLLALLETPQPPSEEAGRASYPGVDRFFVPLILPAGVALLIAGIVFLTSQILLAVPERLATPIALAIALVILLACSLIAMAPRIPHVLLSSVIGAPLLVFMIAGCTAAAYRQANSAQQQQAVQARTSNGATPSDIGTASGAADAAASPLVAKGKQLFTQYTCSGCHGLTGQRVVGPPLNGLLGSQVKFADGTSITIDEAYIRECILHPDTRQVDGYPKGLMPAAVQGFETQIGQGDNLNALLAYLESVK